MATHTVTRYLDLLQTAEGKVALQQARRRVQVGYLLSQTLGCSRRKGSNSEETTSADNIPPQLDSLGTRVAEIIRVKATISHQLHRQSQARVGGLPLAEWRATCASYPQHDLDLLTGLSQATPWIHPGASSKSLLVRELS